MFLHSLSRNCSSTNVKESVEGNSWCPQTGLHKFTHVNHRNSVQNLAVGFAIVGGFYTIFFLHKFLKGLLDLQLVFLVYSASLRVAAFVFCLLTVEL